ncbi:hypothetical protein TRAPUB_10050 [Trametes pubescens]|uniref:Uncharacterized protein n=1 Tax=Trametes pubescens TaxID=154538 RepID=A0A1M2W0M5_TRAPU|nr:hypothetical protein TRAPUB_10050 [Trametes pubescens]
MSFSYDNPQAAPGSGSAFSTPTRILSDSEAGPPTHTFGTVASGPSPPTVVAPVLRSITGVRELVRTPADTTALKNWCDRVAIKWRLTSDQLSDLKQLVEQGASLDIGHLRICLWNQTTLYHLLNKVEAQAIEYEGFKTTMDEVQKQVAAAWAPSKAEHTTIRVITRDMLISPTHTAYTLLSLDVMDYLRTNQVKLGLESAFTTPAREECLAAVVKKKASNARTTLRASLILSIAGKCTKPLEDTTYDILTKLRKGGVGSASDAKADYQIVIALLRRWTFEDHWQGTPAMQEYMKSLRCEEDGDCEPGVAGDQALVAEEESEDEASGPPSKKRRYNSAESLVMRATVGKVAKGEDFFSRMDGRWQASLGLWGLNWKESEMWKRGQDALRADERQRETTREGERRREKARESERRRRK